MVIICLVVGLLLGVLVSLTPALMLATLLSLALGSGLKELLGGFNVAVMATAALGASLYTRRVGMLINPVGVNLQLLASLDPALRMAHSGRAASALRIMVKATTLALVPVMGLIVCLVYLNHIVPNATGAILKGVSAVVPFAIAFWILHTVWKAHDRIGTALGLMVCGYVGYTTFQSALSGAENSIVVLMFGMFTLPMALWTRSSSSAGSLDLNKEETEEERMVGGTGWIGVPIGLVAGTLPGLGNASIVSVFDSQLDTDERYVSAATAAEVSAEVLGVFLVLATGMARSGEAVQIASALNGTTITTSAMVCLVAVLIMGLMVSNMALPKAVSWASQSAHLIPVSLHVGAAVAIGAAQVILVGVSSSEWTLLLASLGTAFMVALGIRILKLPNQVAFGMLSIPVMVMYW